MFQNSIIFLIRYLKVVSVQSFGFRSNLGLNGCGLLGYTPTDSYSILGVLYLPFPLRNFRRNSHMMPGEGAEFSLLAELWRCSACRAWKSFSKKCSRENDWQQDIFIVTARAFELTKETNCQEQEIYPLQVQYKHSAHMFILHWTLFQRTEHIYF